MTTENDEVELSYNKYIDDNDINVSELPSEFIAKFDAIDALIDAYDATGTDEDFAKVETASDLLKADIETWHKAQLVVPVAEPIKITTPVKTTTTPVAPTTTTEPVEEGSGWGRNKSWSRS